MQKKCSFQLRIEIKFIIAVLTRPFYLYKTI